VFHPYNPHPWTPDTFSPSLLVLLLVISAFFSCFSFCVSTPFLTFWLRKKHVGPPVPVGGRPISKMVDRPRCPAPGAFFAAPPPAERPCAVTASRFQTENLFCPSNFHYSNHKSLVKVRADGAELFPPLKSPPPRVLSRSPTSR